MQKKKLNISSQYQLQKKNLRNNLQYQNKDKVKLKERIKKMSFFSREKIKINFQLRQKLKEKIKQNFRAKINSYKYDQEKINENLEKKINWRNFSLKNLHHLKNQLKVYGIKGLLLYAFFNTTSFLIIYFMLQNNIISGRKKN